MPGLRTFPLVHPVDVAGHAQVSAAGRQLGASSAASRGALGQVPESRPPARPLHLETTAGTLPAAHPVPGAHPHPVLGARGQVWPAQHRGLPGGAGQPELAWPDAAARTPVQGERQPLRRQFGFRSAAATNQAPGSL